MSDESTSAVSPEEEQKRKLGDLATKWLKAIEKRRAEEKTWREEQAPKVIARYRDDREAGETGKTRYNIFNANVETLKPAIYSRMPVPDVRRRYPTKDAAARTAALICERALSYYIESCDFADTLDRINEDTLVPGRAQLVVRYKPIFETYQDREPIEPLPDDGENDAEDHGEAPRPPRFPDGTLTDDQGGYRMVDKERVVFSEIAPEYVAWDLFVFGKAKTWRKVPWTATGALLSKDELRKQYKSLTQAQLDQIKFSHSMRETQGGDKEEGHFALVWDIWDRVHRQFIVVADGLESGPLLMQDDPLKLENFLPMPEPIYSIRTNQNWTPKPEYLLYQDQAIQLDEANERLAALTRALKVRGVSDKALDNDQVKLSEIFKQADLTIIPIDNYAALKEKGGIEQALSLVPLDMIVKAIAELKLRVAELERVIYGVTGISDIIRGASVASETATAQQIKAQYSGLRIGKRQSRFQRFVCETLRICAELLMEHADDGTLQMISGLQVLPDQAIEQAKAQKSLQVGQISQTEFQQALVILRSDKMRGFKIDIETDSTIPADKEGEQQRRVEFLGAVGQYLTSIMPAVQGGVVPAPVAREGLLFGIRGFKVGSEFEEVIEQLGQDQNQDEMRGQLQQVQQQLEQCKEQLQQTTQENQKLKSDASAKAQQAQIDGRIKEAESNHQMMLDEREQAHKQKLDAQQQAFDEQLKARDAAHDAHLKSLTVKHDSHLKNVKAETDRNNKAMGERVDKLHKQSQDVPQQFAQAQQQLAQLLAQLTAVVQSIAAPKPSKKRGSMRLPSGGVVNFEMGDEPAETMQ
jgi:hypothetical protein